MTHFRIKNCKTSCDGEEYTYVTGLYVSGQWVGVVRMSRGSGWVLFGDQAGRVEVRAGRA